MRGASPASRRFRAAYGKRALCEMRQHAERCAAGGHRARRHREHHPLDLVRDDQNVLRVCVPHPDAIPEKSERLEDGTVVRIYAHSDAEVARA